MKLSILLAIIGTWSVFASSGYSQETKLSLKLNNVTIKDLFNEIGKKSEFSFWYSNKELDDKSRITLALKNQTIDQILSLALKDQNLAYEIKDRVIIIYRRDMPEVELTLQTRKITGSVTDAATGEPVIGANVILEGTTTGVITDAFGKFNLETTQDKVVLVISFIGYVSERIEVNGQENVDVKLISDIKKLEEIVVIGYGTMKKSDVTGSVTQVKGDQLQARSSETVLQSLQGKAAGVTVINASGAPGSNTSMRIRGFSSNTSSASEPLYIVDGLKVKNISFLDPNIITSVEILKDAASAAIYGAEAGNGVVLITTKQGKKKDGNIFYNMNYGTTSVAYAPDYMNARQYVDYQTAAGYGTLIQQWDGKTDTNWMKELYKTGSIQRHTLGFEGAGDKGSLYTSFSYMNNDGMYVGDKDFMKRLTFQVNASYQIKKWLQITTNNSIEKSDYELKSASPYYEDPLDPIYYDADNLPDYMKSLVSAWGIDMFMNDGKGHVYSIPRYTTDSSNPFTNLHNESDHTEEFNIRGITAANFTPIRDFTFTSRFGYRIGSKDYNSYTVPYYNAVTSLKKPSLNSTTSVSHYYEWENFANYNKTIGLHSVVAMAGMSYQESYDNYTSGTTDALTNDAGNFHYLNYSTSDATDYVGGISGSNTSISYFGRLTYSYADRYNLQLNYRADAFDASKLSKNSRWGYFPSVSMGWTPSNEVFMKSIDPKVLSFLKIRWSYGINGNVNILSGYAYAPTMTTGDMYPVNGSLVTSLKPSDLLANADLKWEKSKQVDVGLDARFLKDRLTLSVDYYNKNTTGLLVKATPPLATGATSVYKNVGKINNHGLEIEIGWKDRIGEFSYGVNANLSTLKNEVEDLGGVSRIQGTYMTYFDAGHPIWSYFGWIYNGIDKDGKAQYKDMNDDKQITEADKSYFGSAIPKYTYGITLSAAYKHFDFMIFGNGNYGGKLYLVESRPHWNRPATYWEDSYAVKGAGAKWPYPDLGDTNMLYSSMFAFSSSYFKIKQVQLGYNVPENLSKKIAIQGLRVYVSLDNFWTFTKYPGVDPETVNADSSMGLDYGAFPMPKTLSFGCNVTF